MGRKKLMQSFMFVFMVVFISGNQHVSYSTAVDKCQEHNGLASYKHFIDSSQRWVKKYKHLHEGESTWISGNVSFSDKFVRWYGCFRIEKDGVRKYSLLGYNDINGCLQKCSGAQPNFIGVGYTLCFCITNNDIQGFLLSMTNDSECEQKLLLPNVHQGKANGSKLKEINIDVYAFTDIKSLKWKAPSNKNIHQCVYYQSDGKEEGYVMGSCYSKEVGLLCTNDAKGSFMDKNACNPSYFMQINDRSFCYHPEPNPWISSFKYCRQHSANLQGKFYSNFKEKLNQSMKKLSFWTGFFRSFHLTEYRDNKASKESHICLSVINLNSTIGFDLSDCMANKRFICEDSFSGNEEQTSYKNSDNTMFLSTLSPSTDINSTLTPDSFADRDNLIIIIVLINVIFFSFFIFVLFRKKIKHCMCRQGTKTGPNYNENTSTNSWLRSGSAENVNVPKRQSISNRSIDNEADYALPSDDVQMNNIVESEYDKVNTNECRAQNKSQSSKRNFENEYSVHTGLMQDIDNNEYDHIGAGNGKQSQVLTDAIYNTMILEKNSDTYSGLKMKNTINVDETDTRIVKSCSTYDRIV